MEQRAIERNNKLELAALISPLFVPGDRPDRVRKAMDRGAQGIIIDLEDAVELNSKNKARRETANALTGDWRSLTRMVRVNSVADQAELQDDLAALRPVLPLIDVIILPKAESKKDVQKLQKMLLQFVDLSDVPSLVPTIESASAVFHARDIASATDSIHTLLFGVADLSSELGVTPTAEGRELLTARSLVVMACAAAGVSKPWNGPHLNIDDQEGLKVAAENAFTLGFGGMVSIHPRQLETVTNTFVPSVEELAWATRVLEAFATAKSQGLGATRLSDGTFIDQPIATRAKSILNRARTA